MTDEELSANPEQQDADPKPENTGHVAGEAFQSDEDAANALAEQRKARAEAAKEAAKSDDDPEPDDFGDGKSAIKKDDPKDETGEEDEEDAEADSEADESDDNDEDSDEESGEYELDEPLQLKINGKMEEVTFEDLVSTYSKSRGIEKKLNTLNQKETELVDRETTLTKHHEEALHEVAGLGQKLYEQIQTDDRYSKETMEDLRLDNPSEWSARREELRDKQALLASAQRLQAKKQGEQQAKAKESFDRYAESEAQKLTKVWGESDPKQFESRLKEVNSYIVANYDIEQAEADGLIRADLLMIAEKAMKYDNARKGVKDATKQVRKAPKMLRPSGRKADQGKASVAAKNLAEAQKAHKASGSNQTAVALMKAKREVGRLKKKA